MATDLQKHKFSVYSLDILCGRVVQGVDLTSHEAADLFWHHTNNISARSGIIKEVRLVDEFDCTCLLWELGRGYSYDGETWTDKPVIPTEKSYGKEKA
jgi:hypothetical protein